MRRLLLPLLLLIAVHSAHAQIETRSIAQVLAETEDFSAFYAALDAAGLLPMLDSPTGLYTVFAVENDAMPPAGEPFAAAFHLLPGEFTHYELSALSEPTSFLSLSGTNIVIVSLSEEIVVNEQTLVATDTMGANGVIHTLSEALPLQPADADAAIRPGPNVMFRPLDTAVGSLAAHPQFTWFAAAAESADLVQVLDQSRFTILAFSNASFEAFILQEGYASVEQALADHVRMQALIRYHVIPAGFLWDEFHSGSPTRIGTLYPGLAVYFENNLINGFTVSAWDIPTESCVIHIVDSVLVPPTLSETVP